MSFGEAGASFNFSDLFNFSSQSLITSTLKDLYDQAYQKYQNKIIIIIIIIIITNKS